MTPEQQATIISQSAHGLTTRNISTQVGLSHVSVARHQAALRPLIYSEISKIITAGLTIARKATLRAAAEVLIQYKAKDKGQPYDKELIGQGLQASKLILQATGMIGQPSTIINNITQINNSHTIPESVGIVLSQIAHNTTSQGNLLSECEPHNTLVDI